MNYPERGTSTARRSDQERAATQNKATVRPGRLTKILALSVASLITLGVCELALRLLWHNPYRYEEPDLLLKIATHHPNSDYFVVRDAKDPQNSIRLRTDKRSYVLPSFQYPDPELTIGFLGGSTTECLLVHEDLRFPALVSTFLGERGLKVNTLNSGRSGNTLHDSINILINHMVEDRPDIVVLMHAANDVGILTAAEGYQSRMGHSVSARDMSKWFVQMASSKVFLAALVRSWQPSVLLNLAPVDGGGASQAPAQASTPQQRTENTAEKPGANPRLVPKPLVDVYRQRLKAFVHIARDFGIQPILMTEPFSGSVNALTPDWVNARPMDQFNQVIREVGADEGAEVIDLVQHLQESVPNWQKHEDIFYDGIHVTEKGSRVYAEYITERLLPLVKQKAHASHPEAQAGAVH